MLTFGKRRGAAALAGLAAFALAAPTLQAQPPRPGPQPSQVLPRVLPTVFNPFTQQRILGFNALQSQIGLNQWAANAALVGRYNALAYGLSGYNPAAGLFGAGTGIYNPGFANYGPPPYQQMPYPVPYPVPSGGGGGSSQAVLTTVPSDNSGGVNGPTMTSVPTSPYAASGGGNVNYTSSYDPLSGFLQGTASIYDAQGRYEINHETSLIMREQRRQAQLGTFRRILDEWNYERANTPTLQDNLERAQAQAERRAIRNPEAAQVLSADALNTILRRVQRGKLPSGYDEPLQADVVKQINVSTGSSNGGLGAIRNIKDASSINWPLPLQVATLKNDRDTVNTLLPDIVNDLNAGKVDQAKVQTVRTALQHMDSRLDTEFVELSPTDSIFARRFVRQLLEACTTLQRDDAARYLTKLDGIQSVGDLIKKMTAQGLQFAPAANGDEASYMALWNALARYSTAVPEGPAGGSPGK